MNLITDICFISPYFKNIPELTDLFRNGYLTDLIPPVHYPAFVEGLSDRIQSPIKKRMSQLTQGVYAAMEEGPGKTLKESDEIYLFTAFAEIDTTNEIIKAIELEKATLVSPTHFHNSVHNTPLGYYAIIKKIHNYTTTISDGTLTGLSFINFIKNKSLLDTEWVVASGEEYSDFLKLDRINNKVIVPSFIAYRISSSADKGFRFLGTGQSIDSLISQSLNDYQFIFADEFTFSEIKRTGHPALYSEKKLIADIPEGIIYRLALPFILQMSGKGLVIDYHSGNYYLFEIVL